MLFDILELESGYIVFGAQIFQSLGNHFCYTLIVEVVAAAVSAIPFDYRRLSVFTDNNVAIVGLLVYLFRFRPESRWMQVSMALIIGGGIGNMIDRLILGYVIDFLDFTLINFAVFNVADSFVCIGAGMMILYLVKDLIKEIKLERAKKAEEKNDADVE